MSNRKPHRLTGRAHKEAREDALDTKCRTSYRERGPRRYWMVNTSTNRVSDRTVTMDEFLDYTRRNLNVSKRYRLVEMKQW